MIQHSKNLKFWSYYLESWSHLEYDLAAISRGVFVVCIEVACMNIEYGWKDRGMGNFNHRKLQFFVLFCHFQFERRVKWIFRIVHFFETLHPLRVDTDWILIYGMKSKFIKKWKEHFIEHICTFTRYTILTFIFHSTWNKKRNYHSCFCLCSIENIFFFVTCGFRSNINKGNIFKSFCYF